MEIKDLVNIQDRYSDDMPFVHALRTTFNESGNVAVLFARKNIIDSDWIEETTTEEKGAEGNL